MSSLKQRFEDICTEYIKAFCKKQEMEFNGWVGDSVGEVAYIEDYYLNFDDIRLDVDANQPKGKMLDWYNQEMEARFTDSQGMNYRTYVKINTLSV